eukprot:gene899-527_t
MEQPYYGRTGLLESRVLEPLPPPSAQWAARYAKAAGTLKWSPESLHVVPQRLLRHLLHEAGHVPRPFGSALLLQTLAEALAATWWAPTSSTGEAPAARDALSIARRRGQWAVLSYLLDWHQRAVEAGDAVWIAQEREALGYTGGPEEGLSWYLPSYTLTAVKEGSTLEQFAEVSWRGVTLLGKDPSLNDIVLAHPSCSSQHAALQVAFTSAGWEEDTLALIHEHRQKHAGADEVHGELQEVATSGQLFPYFEYLQRKGDAQIDDLLHSLYTELLGLVMELGGVQQAYTLELQLVDLGSTNGTAVNGDRLSPLAPHTLVEGDVIRFGISTRSYGMLAPMDWKLLAADVLRLSVWRMSRKRQQRKRSNPPVWGGAAARRRMLFFSSPSSLPFTYTLSCLASAQQPLHAIGGGPAEELLLPLQFLFYLSYRTLLLYRRLHHPTQKPPVGRPTHRQRCTASLTAMPSAVADTYDGYALLRDQSRLLSASSPTEINSTLFLRIKLAAQQKRTAQLNQLQRGLHDTSTPSRAEELALNGPAAPPRTSSTPNAADADGASAAEMAALGGGPSGRPSHADPNKDSKPNLLDEVPATATGMREQEPEVLEVVLAPCPYCGRSFAEDRLDRHIAMCVKMSKSEQDRQRKQRQLQRRDGPAGPSTPSELSNSGLGSSAEWRKQSTQLRSALSGEMVEDDRLPCPYCRRRFQAETAARHIPLCKDRMSRLR